MQTGYPTPPGLDYGQPPARDFRPSDVLGPLIAWGAFAGVVIATGPLVLKVRQTFADFNVKLPGVTVALLNVQTWLTTWAGLAGLLLIPVGMTAIAWPANRRGKRLIARAGIVFTLLFIAYVVVCLVCR